MNRNAHVVALCGSLSSDSSTRIALQEALDAAEVVGASTELVDLREFHLPPRDGDDRDVGDAEELRERVRAADAVILGSPMYHGSYSSPLKTALDYCGFDEFEDTTVGLLAVSGGSFPTRVLDHMRAVARAVDAWVVPHEVGVPNTHANFEDGELVDEDLAERVRELGEEVVEYAGVEAYPDVSRRPAEPATMD